MSDIEVFYEATPNPNSLKFVITTQIADESLQFNSQQECSRSPLAYKIFGFPWAAGVFVGPNFVTITKQEWVEWEILADPLADLIKEHLVSGQAVLLPPVTGAQQIDEDHPDDSPIVKQIRKVLREEIRPAVAMDGGDIVFQKFENGRVFVSLHGACSGCPSSTFTLKEGIETRLKALIPEVTEVVAV